MSLFLDSADLDEIADLSRFGVVRGVTTNPSLLRPHTTKPLGHLEQILASIDTVPVMYQPTKLAGDAFVEGQEAYALCPERVVLKIPATPNDLQTAARFVADGIPVALTAAASQGHMLVCEAIRATYIIPYVDRYARDARVGRRIVRELDEVRRSEVVIVAASVKSPTQAIEARLDGADIVSAPAPVLHELLSHVISDEATDRFDSEYATR